MMDNNDSAQAIGHVRILVHDADGSLVSDNLHKNTLTNYARNASAQLWTGTTLVTPTKIELGNGAPTLPLTTTDPTDTDLWTPQVSTLQVCDFEVVWLSYYSQYSVTYATTSAVGTWTECGLKDANGNLWSHVALNNFIKLNTQTVTVQWQIQHLAS
jgi:hypothetical protein